MQFVRFGILVFACSFVISGQAFAQDADYNDALKQQLKTEDAPVTPPKKVVHKRIHKTDSQTAKVAAQKKAMAKNVKVAQTESNVTNINVEPVQAKQVQAAKDEEIEAPVLGAAQPAPYQPIFILQPAPQVQAQPVAAAPVVAGPQVQPTTNVDSTSVPEPRSEQLRHQREDLEHQTESKLIEKLEDDRMSSEKDRANKIFNPQPSPTPSAVVAPVAAAPVAAPMAAPVITPVVAVEPEAAPVAVPAAATAVVTPATTPVSAVKQVEEVKTEPAPVVAPEMQGETKTQADTNAVPKPEDKKRFSIGAVGGLPSYPGVSNISSLYAFGALADYKFADHLALQAQFDYSKYNITNVSYCPFCYGGTLVKGLNQYDVSMGLNYSPITLGGSVTPVVGALLDFTRRNYFDVVDYGYTYGTPSGSNAFNAGLMAGVDFNLSKSIILGFQFSYLWNISYWTDDPLAYGFYGPIYGSPIESLSYFLATLNLRFVF